MGKKRGNGKPVERPNGTLKTSNGEEDAAPEEGITYSLGKKKNRHSDDKQKTTRQRRGVDIQADQTTKGQVNGREGSTSREPIKNVTSSMFAAIRKLKKKKKKGQPDRPQRKGGGKRR